SRRPPRAPQRRNSLRDVLVRRRDERRLGNRLDQITTWWVRSGPAQQIGKHHFVDPKRRAQQELVRICRDQAVSLQGSVRGQRGPRLLAQQRGREPES